MVDCRAVHHSGEKIGPRARTSTQFSSFMSRASSLALEPLMAILLVGGASSSAAPMAGLFLSSILQSVDGRGEAAGVVATGIRPRVQRDVKRSAGQSQGQGSTAKWPPSHVSSRGRPCKKSSSGAWNCVVVLNGGRRSFVAGVEISKSTHESRGLASGLVPRYP